jgi:hypothetical protein
MKLSGWSNDVKCMVEGGGGTKHQKILVKKEVIFGCYAFFCMPVYISLYTLPWQPPSHV